MQRIEELKKMAVIGSGAIGPGIAQLFAMAGYEVVMIDVNAENLKKGKDKIKWSLAKFVEKKRIRKEDAAATISRISTTTSYEQACRNIDFAIEAVSENMKVKREVFATLDSVAPSHAIFASNTSTLSITQIGKATKRPDKTAGMHFFNPPQQMALVEVIKGKETSQETLETLTAFAEKIGKNPVIVRKDVCGFIVNRILSAVFLEAFWACHRQETTKERVDASVKYIGGFPMGWFELADFSGLDIVYEVGKNLYEAYGERFKPCTEVIEPLVNKRKFGQKTGIGFYDWTKGRPSIPLSLQGEYDAERSWAVAVNEASWLVYEDVASPKDVDIGMRLGTYWPSGPCEYADKIGLDIILSKLRGLYAEYKMEMYKPCPLLEEYVRNGWTGKKAERGFY